MQLRVKILVFFPRNSPADIALFAEKSPRPHGITLVNYLNCLEFPG